MRTSSLCKDRALLIDLEKASTVKSYIVICKSSLRDKDPILRLTWRAMTHLLDSKLQINITHRCTMTPMPSTKISKDRSKRKLLWVMRDILTRCFKSQSEVTTKMWTLIRELERLCTLGSKITLNKLCLTIKLTTPIECPVSIRTRGSIFRNSSNLNPKSWATRETQISDPKETKLWDKISCWRQIRFHRSSYHNLANSSKNNKTWLETSKTSMELLVDKRSRAWIVLWTRTIHIAEVVITETTSKILTHLLVCPISSIKRCRDSLRNWGHSKCSMTKFIGSNSNMLLTTNRDLRTWTAMQHTANPV